MDGQDKTIYEQPKVVDYGDLKDLTESTVFYGTEDARAKGNPTDPVPHFSR